MSVIDLAKKRDKQCWYENNGTWWRAFVNARGKIALENTWIRHAVPYWQARREYVRIQCAQRSGT